MAPIHVCSLVVSFGVSAQVIFFPMQFCCCGMDTAPPHPPCLFVYCHAISDIRFQFQHVPIRILYLLCGVIHVSSCHAVDSVNVENVGQQCDGSANPTH